MDSWSFSVRFSIRIDHVEDWGGGGSFRILKWDHFNQAFLWDSNEILERIARIWGRFRWDWSRSEPSMSFFHAESVREWKGSFSLISSRTGRNHTATKEVKYRSSDWINADAAIATLYHSISLCIWLCVSESERVDINSFLLSVLSYTSPSKVPSETGAQRCIPRGP